MLYLRRAWISGDLPSSTLHETQQQSAEGMDGTTSGHSHDSLGWNRSPPFDDPDGLEYWLRAWSAGGPSGPGGDTLHRLYVRDVLLRGRWPAQPHLAVGEPLWTSNTTVSTSSSPRSPRSPVFPDNAEDDGIRMQIGVGEFSSESVGEHFR